ncbi:GTP cyclohydrolase II [Brevibacterium daeguense]|uniref:GTP cyclohydrolase-2 n=2 Tax=Brevibacterium daeguense TaxID=909936 RepID=A0ABP8ELU6_9MICO
MPGREPTPVWSADTILPTAHGRFRMLAHTDRTGVEHLALLMGNPETADAPLVRVHSECLTGDALGSYRCDCGEQLDISMAHIAAAGCGILLYLRGHEGRGIGLLNKLRAYELQDRGLDTVEANAALGLPIDARDYQAAAAMLRALDCTRIRLLTANPLKQIELEANGIEVVDRLRPPVADRPENSHYLETKRSGMNHDRPSDSDASPLPDLYTPLVGRTEVIAQLAQSTDGFIAANGGDAEFVSGAADREHLHRLRSLAAVVLVGVSTVRADDPKLTVRAVQGPNPVRAILDPHGRVPLDSHVLTQPDAPTLWLLGERIPVPESLASHVTVLRLPETAGQAARGGSSRDDPAGDHPARGGAVEEHCLDVPPAVILQVLGRHVPGTVLVEGGGRTVSEFLSAGLLDRLFLTVAPVLIGNGVPGLRFTGSDVMAEALRAPFRRHVFGADVCTEFVFSAAARAATPGLSDGSTPLS